MPTFYMTVGLPGSGKSTFVNSVMNAKVHSSDQIRHELLGDYTDQTDNSTVFAELHRRVFDDLKNGIDVVYDATNFSYKRRRHFLDQLRKQGIKNLTTTCLFFATPFTECLDRNASRENPVPYEVIRRMYLSFDVPMELEGWNNIVVLNDVPRNVPSMFKALSQIEHDNPHHTLTIGQHMIAAGAYLEDSYPDASLALMAATYLHDVGKADTKSFVNSHGEVTEIAHYYNHERVGAYDSFRYTTFFPEKDRLYIALLIRWHMVPFMISKSENPTKTKAKFVKLLGEQTFEDIMKLHQCDISAH